MVDLSSLPEPAPLAERLRTRGIRPTPQRLRIAALLLVDPPAHHSAEQVLADLQQTGMQVSKATVYNTLNLFAAHGLIRQFAVDGDRMWFDPNVTPHHHFHDTETGQLTDLPLPAVRFAQLPEPPPGMEVTGVDVLIRVRRRRS